MWTNPGDGYCYSSQGVHVVSILLRNLVGMEMEAYIRQSLATSMEFGGWGYVGQAADSKKLEHTPGGGGIALRPRMRFDSVICCSEMAPINGDAETRRALEMVIGSVRD
jgi:CubicO group peptidase (beta-lactamase class C family)